MTKIQMFLLGCLCTLTVPAHADQIDRDKINFTLTHQAVLNIYSAIHPLGPKDVAPGGTNFRAVMKGLLYRGGSGGMYGLDQTQLQIFCNEGFSNVTFGYSGGDLGQVTCAGNSFNYEFASPNNANGAFQFLSRVSEALRDNKGPVFVHCWGGSHQSGELAAYALQLFCGYSAAEAKDYWQRDSNGASPGFSAPVLANIDSFGNYAMNPSSARYSQFQSLRNGISQEVLDDVCPRP